MAHHDTELACLILMGVAALMLALLCFDLIVIRRIKDRE